MSFWVIQQHFHCSPHQLCVLLVRVDIRIVVIDFGKATNTIQSKFLYLSQQEKLEYQQKYPQIAFAIGGVLYRIAESGLVRHVKQALKQLQDNVTQCN